jgi:hypothetical protein
LHMIHRLWVVIAGCRDEMLGTGSHSRRCSGERSAPRVSKLSDPTGFVGGGRAVAKETSHVNSALEQLPPSTRNPGPTMAIPAPVTSGLAPVMGSNGSGRTRLGAGLHAYAEDADVVAHEEVSMRTVRS